MKILSDVKEYPPNGVVSMSVALKVDGRVSPLLFQFEMTVVGAHAVGWKLITGNNNLGGFLLFCYLYD